MSNTYEDRGLDPESVERLAEPAQPSLLELRRRRQGPMKWRLLDFLGIETAVHYDGSNQESSNREAADILLTRIPSPGPAALRRMIDEAERRIDDRSDQITQLQLQQAADHQSIKQFKAQLD